MYSYVYSSEAVDSTVTSTGYLRSTQLVYNTFTVLSATYAYVDVTTFTTSSVRTYTSGQTYTITDYTSGTTETCDYSVTASPQFLSTLDSDSTGSTYSYKSITHSTNGSHSVSDSVLILVLSSSYGTSYTNACAYTYFDTQSTSGSTAYGGTRTLYTGSSIFHTPFKTHTVSSVTIEITKAYEYATTYTQSCDYLESSSLQSTSGSSNFGGYTQSTFISTFHGQYGTHTVVSRTVEIASSNASLTASYVYFSENTANSTVTRMQSTIATWSDLLSQTALNTQTAVGTSSSFTNTVGLTTEIASSTASTDFTIQGFSDGLTGVTDGNSIYYFKQISSQTIDVFYSTHSITDVTAFAEYNTAYYQAEVDVSSSSSAFYSFTRVEVYRTGADVVSGKKVYTTEAYTNSFFSYTSSSRSSQYTTSYGSTRQTSSAAYNSLSATTTKSSTVFEARFTSTTVSLTETITTKSSSGTNTITSTRTYSGFSTNIASFYTQTQGTTYFPVGNITITKTVDWFTAYVRDNGEILMALTNATAASVPLSEAGLLTTAWSNGEAVRTTSSSQSGNSGIYYTFNSGATYTTNKLISFGSLSINQFSMYPWSLINYNAIENAYEFSRIGSSSSSYNPDLSVFSMSEYLETAGSVTQSVTLNRGPYLMTLNSLSGATSATSTAVSSLTFTETGYARKIKPMSFVSFFSAIMGYPQVTNFTTSNTILKI